MSGVPPTLATKNVAKVGHPAPITLRLGGRVRFDEVKFFEQRLESEFRSQHVEVGLRQHHVTINPFALEPTLEHLHFLHAFTRLLIESGDGYRLSDLEDRDQIGLVMDAFRSSHRRAVSVLFTNGERPGIHVGVTDDLVAQGVKAGDIAAALAAVSGGKGGGRPHFASAGAGDPARLGETRAQTAAIVRRLLAR